MRSLLPYLLLIVASFSVVHGRTGYSFTRPKVVVASNRRRSRRTVAQKSKKAKPAAGITFRATITSSSPLVRIPWRFVKRITKPTIHGYVGGYVVGAVCSPLWGVIRDYAMDGENGRGDLGDHRAYRWGKKAGKWCARFFAVAGENGRGDLDDHRAYRWGKKAGKWFARFFAKDGENGLGDLDDRAFRWGEKAAKWNARFFAITFPLLFVVMQWLQTHLDGMLEKGEIDDEMYRDLIHDLDEIKKDNGLNKE